jgi:hypothetical protein
LIQNHRKILNLLVFALILIFSGCALNSFRGPIQLSSNSQIEVVSAAARSKPGGIAIYGDVRRRDGQAKSVPGHLHFVATDDAGRVIAMTDAPWGEFMSRRLRRAYYTAFLSIDRPSTTTTISIAVVLNAQS